MALWRRRFFRPLPDSSFASNTSTPPPHDTQTYPRIWTLKTAFHSGLKGLFNTANNDPTRPNNLLRFHLIDSGEMADVKEKRNNLPHIRASSHLFWRRIASPIGGVSSPVGRISSRIGHVTSPLLTGGLNLSMGGRPRINKEDVKGCW